MPLYISIVFREGVKYMAKAKRGSGLKKDSQWRGNCPICERTGVKLLWEGTKDEDKVSVCKYCKGKEV